MKKNNTLLSLVIAFSILFTPTSLKINHNNAMAAGSSSTLKIHYLNVGQADSILITNNGKAMLIDAGNNNDGKGVVEYLKKKGIKKLSYVIGTHPHEDHIGGLDDVIKSFSIGKVIMPNETSTTQTYKDVISALKKKKLKITKPTVGKTYKLNKANFTLLSPSDSSYSDTNAYSVVIRLVFGSKKFLFTGDATNENETTMISSGEKLASDILKIGHHGSDTSTSKSFLDEVDPSYAVISVGKGNSYGHPTSGTLAKLTSRKIKVYRTDKDGTIVLTTNGKTLKFAKVKTSIDGAGSYTKPKPKKQTPKKSSKKSSTTVYITETGEKYHRSSCRYLSSSKIKISKSKAKSSGYTPCSVCKP